MKCSVLNARYIFYIYNYIYKILYIFQKQSPKVLTNKFQILYNYVVIKHKGVLNMETKREKFVRLAEARTNKIIDMVRLLGNCANKSNYDYTDADIQKIFTAIEKELKNTKLKFSVSEVEDDKFRL